MSIFSCFLVVALIELACSDKHVQTQLSSEKLRLCSFVYPDYRPFFFVHLIKSAIMCKKAVQISNYGTKINEIYGGRFRWSSNATVRWFHITMYVTRFMQML